MPRISDFEFTAMVASASAANIYLGFGARRRPDIIDSPNGSVIILINGANAEIYLVDHTGTSRLLRSVAHGIAWNVNAWYMIKFRMVGRTCKLKIWLYGTAEPDWLAVAYCTYTTDRCDDSGIIAFRVVGDPNPNRYISDIRITPIYKTGGGAP